MPWGSSVQSAPLPLHIGICRVSALLQAGSITPPGGESCIGDQGLSDCKAFVLFTLHHCLLRCVQIPSTACPRNRYWSPTEKMGNNSSCLIHFQGDRHVRKGISSTSQTIGNYKRYLLNMKFQGPLTSTVSEFWGDNPGNDVLKTHVKHYSQ